jgi:hypothetical protein
MCALQQAQKRQDDQGIRKMEKKARVKAQRRHKANLMSESKQATPKTGT